MDNREQIERITKYEAMMDRVAAANAALEKALELFAKTDELSAELGRYLAGEDWKQDFYDDEDGLLPKDLKRGVLSEDGLYDVLEARRALYGEMLRVCASFFGK